MRSCNLCGKRAVAGRKRFSHGDNHFRLCRACAKGIKNLRRQTQHLEAKAYLESKLAIGQNDSIRYIIQNRIQNSANLFDSKDEEEEENPIVALIKTVGLLGGILLFLLGICMLNIHLKAALAIVGFSITLAVFLYIIGQSIAFILHCMKKD